VQGLRYQTPTRSGFTNVAGEFVYLPGEVVTFSIGGTTLGSIAGAASVSPFPLAGVTPPRTEAALRAELGTWRDVTGFDRAANMMLLLYALDIDRNGANGIDLTGVHARLAAEQVDLDAPLYEFAWTFASKYTFVLGIHREIPIEAPLVHFYGALGIAVPVRAESSYVVSFDGGGIVDRLLIEHDAAGQVTARLGDWDTDGIPESAERFEWSGGLLASFSFEPDSDEDGVPDRRQASGGPRNAWGRYLMFSSTDDFEADGVADQRFDTTYNYDAAGILQSIVSSDDWNGDGQLETTSTDVFTVDARGRVTGMVQEVDRFADGVVDERGLRSHTFDGRDNPVTQTEEYDPDADGDVDSVSTTTSAYDARGNLLTRTRAGQIPPSAPFLSRRETYSYDARDNIVGLVAERSFDNGAPEIREAWTATYDSRNNLLTLAYEERVHGDLDSAETRELTYDGSGRLLTDVRRRDHDGNGEWNVTDTFVYTYGANGERLTETETNLVPNPPGETSVVTYSHDTQLDNGLLYLLRHYQQASNVSPMWWQ
jgi:hypothetical protein